MSPFAAFAPTSALLIGPHNVFVRNGLTLNDRSALETYWIEELSGFESPALRISSTENVQEHGTLPDPGFYGDRVMTMTGWIQAGTYTKVLAMGRALLDSLVGLVETPLLITTQASILDLDPEDTMFQMPDVTIDCRPSDRVQLATQIIGSDMTGVFKRNFTIALVASDPAYRSVEVHSLSDDPTVLSELGRVYDRTYDLEYDTLLTIDGDPATVGEENLMTAHNAGNFDATPIIRFNGAMSGSISLSNDANGHTIHLAADVASGDFVEIDVKTGDVIDAAGNDIPSSLDSRSDWMRLRGTRDLLTGAAANGDNLLELSAQSLGVDSSIEVFWQDTWI